MDSPIVRTGIKKNILVVPSWNGNEVAARIQLPPAIVEWQDLHSGNRGRLIKAQHASLYLENTHVFLKEHHPILKAVHKVPPRDNIPPIWSIPQVVESIYSTDFEKPLFPVDDHPPAVSHKFGSMRHTRLTSETVLLMNHLLHGRWIWITKSGSEDFDINLTRTEDLRDAQTICFRTEENYQLLKFVRGINLDDVLKRFPGDTPRFCGKLHSF